MAAMGKRTFAIKVERLAGQIREIHTIENGENFSSAEAGFSSPCSALVRSKYRTRKNDHPLSA